MEVERVVTVDNLLIHFLADLTHPAGSTVDNEEHEERLLLAELRERLKHIIRGIVTQIILRSVS